MRQNSQLLKENGKLLENLTDKVRYLRLSGGPIDSEVPWVEAAYGAREGQLNAWPLDENMIDYTTDANANVATGYHAIEFLLWG